MPLSLSLDYIRSVVKEAKPSRLTLPVPPRVDHADHIVKTALEGYPKLAADHIVHPEIAGRLLDVVGAIVRRANIMILERPLSEGLPERDVKEIIVLRYRIYDMVLEVIWNLTGMERKWAGFSREEAEKAIRALLNALKEWESLERREIGSPVILKAVISDQLRSMKIVNKGNSMLAWMASEVEKELDENNLAESYVNSLRKLITSNFYYQSYEKGMCKFGNDYALGLRWLRHLGYVQVSTNPALAAKAYDDDPELWEKFKDYAREVLAKEHPEWFKDPDKYADDIAMEATRFGLLDNFYVFRVPFGLSKFHDGLVSYQLNPLIAGSVEESVKAAREFARRLERDLMVYDSYLWWGYSTPVERGRPNVVIKVAAAYPASIEIAEKLNEMGIGQNITVSYTVSQEVLVAYGAMKGMAKAIRKGILPTQTYDTNMGGRLEDHLREVKAAELLLKGLEKAGSEKAEKILDKLARDLGVSSDVWEGMKGKPLKERVEFLTSKKVLGRNLLRDAFVNALVETGAYGDRDSVIKMLTPLENAIKLSGTYVAHRVYEILFSPWNRVKWVEHLAKEFNLTIEEAETVLDRIDLLPASKRKPIDTLLTLSGRNMTNTEFPNHQLAVIREVEGKRIDDYRESIVKRLDEEPLRILMQIEDFVKAYEASPEVNELLKKVGIVGDYGSRGVRPEEWPNYGPCVKTMKEFTNAYLKFREKVVKAIKEIASKQ